MGPGAFDSDNTLPRAPDSTGFVGGGWVTNVTNALITQYYMSWKTEPDGHYKIYFMKDRRWLLVRAENTFDIIPCNRHISC